MWLKGVIICHNSGFLLFSEPAHALALCGLQVPPAEFEKATPNNNPSFLANFEGRADQHMKDLPVISEGLQIHREFGLSIFGFSWTDLYLERMMTPVVYAAVNKIPLPFSVINGREAV